MKTSYIKYFKSTTCLFKNKARNMLHLLSFILIVSIFSACKKLVQEGPPATSITASTVYANNNSASAVMTGLYTSMLSGQTFDGSGSIGYEMGLAADELTLYSNVDLDAQFYTNSLSSSSSGGSNDYFWGPLYNDIYVCNAVIEGVSKSTGITPKMKQQLIGEAEFMRAFLHLYLTNLYGDVPVVLTTDFQHNNTIKRSAQSDVYHQIIVDLKDAQSKLSDDFKDPYGNTTTERTRPNKGAATALLSRVYLYTGDWTDAITESSNIIGSSNHSLVTDLSQVFIANSSEAIWQLQPLTPATYNTLDATVYVLTSTPGTNGQNVALSSSLKNAFEPTDLRFTNWVAVFSDPDTNILYYYPFKYKVYLSDEPVSEYKMVLRLSEQYLIRAEAETQLNKFNDAQTDINTIRRRAGLANTAASDRPSLLTAIAHEAQVELFTEWGQRWFDLKRNNELNAVMGSPGNVCNLKGGTWESYKALLPLPLGELQKNRNLTQNAGY